MPPTKHYNPIRSCKICSTEHEEEGKICANCGMCFRLCVRAPEPIPCKWYEAPNLSKSPTIPQQQNVAGDDVKDLSLPVYENLKDAFKSWVASSTKLNTDLAPSVLWEEFEIFAKEQLQPVDSEKNYLQIDTKAGNFKTLDAKKLYRNQEGEYVLVENLKRIRIGRMVAVM